MRKAFVFLLLLSFFLVNLFSSKLTIDIEKASLDELLSIRRTINDRIASLQSDPKETIEWTEQSDPIVLYSDEDLIVLFKGFIIERNSLRFNIYVENNSNSRVEIGPPNNTVFNNANVSAANWGSQTIYGNTRFSTLSEYIWIFHIDDLKKLYGDERITSITLYMPIKKGYDVVRYSSEPLNLKTDITL